jgi:hypothetical protein
VFRELDTIQVRGRVQRERVFELVARSEQPATARDPAQVQA